MGCHPASHCPQVAHYHLVLLSHQESRRHRRKNAIRTKLVLNINKFRNASNARKRKLVKRAKGKGKEREIDFGKGKVISGKRKLFWERESNFGKGKVISGKRKLFRERERESSFGKGKIILSP